MALSQIITMYICLVLISKVNFIVKIFYTTTNSQDMFRWHYSKNNNA
jgi:hypothetical protein